MVSRHKQPDKSALEAIRREVAMIFHEMRDVCSRVPGEDIFRILERKGTVILESFKETDLWGIYICKKKRNFFFINSSLPLEKQIFAAAHELAHSLEIAKISAEVLKGEVFADYISGNGNQSELLKAELIANRFAAELLVDEKILFDRFSILKKTYDIEVIAVKLSDFFLVPFRTVAKRLIETDLISDVEADRLLSKNDDDIKVLAGRYECCSNNFKISGIQKTGGYKNKALTLYENELMTYARLSKILKTINETPEDNNIDNMNHEIIKDHDTKTHGS